MQETISISTSKSQEIIDISSHIDSIIGEYKGKFESYDIFSLYSYSAIVIDENADANNKCTSTLTTEVSYIREGNIIREGKVFLMSCLSQTLFEMDCLKDGNIELPVFGD
jgi:hypothetical protein